LDLEASRSGIERGELGFTILSEGEAFVAWSAGEPSWDRGLRTSYILSDDKCSSRGVELLLIEVLFLKRLYRPGLELAVELDIELVGCDGCRIIDIFCSCSCHPVDQVSGEVAQKKISILAIVCRYLEGRR
jgi:hypothetical protein